MKIKKQTGFYQLTFSDHFDDECINFEECLVGEQKNVLLTVEENNISKEIEWPSITFWQSYRYHSQKKSPYYLLQMINLKTNRRFQIVVNVEKSKLTFFKTGHANKWIYPLEQTIDNDLLIFFSQLLYFLKNETSLMQICIGLYLPGKNRLNHTSELLSSMGFYQSKPRSYKMTRFFDLAPTVEDLINSFSANGRARIKKIEKKASEIEVKSITQPSYIPALNLALNCSYQRSNNKEAAFDFDTLFNGLAQNNKDISILGFFFNDQVPKAFVSAIRHNCISEYTAGGSVNDPALRSLPFNHYLLWKLALWAKEHGSKLFDLGGITDASEEDPLKNISEFKRMFPGFELMVGRDLSINLKSGRLMLYVAIKSLIQKCKKIVRRI